MAGGFNHFLSTLFAIHPASQVAERMNWSISEGITTLLSQSGLMRTWWEDAAVHWLYGPTVKSGSHRRLLPLHHSPSLSCSMAGSLTYPPCALGSASSPPMHTHWFTGYPPDYKGWRFWDPRAHKEVVSDSAVFRESVPRRL